MPLCGLKSVMSVPFSVHIALTIVLSSCKCAGFVEVKKKKTYRLSVFTQISLTGLFVLIHRLCVV